MDKLEAAEFVKSHVLSFETIKDEDDYGFQDLFVHEKAKAGGLIHFTSENEYMHRTLFSYEKYLNNYHIFFMTSMWGVDNLFNLVELYQNKSSLTTNQRILAKLKFVQSYCSSLEKAIPKKYDMLKDERLDRFRIDIDDETNQFVISHTTAFFSYMYPSIYVTFVVDKNHNLINIGFDDAHVKELMKDLTIEQKIKAFGFFIDYFVQKDFRTLVNIDYKEVNLDNLHDYLTLHEMYEV